MPDEASNSEADEQSQDLDLSSLGGLSLGPQWGSGSIPPSKTPKTRGGFRDDRPGGRFGAERGERRGRSASGSDNRRDRRGGKTARRSDGDGGGFRGRGTRHGAGRGQGHRFDEPPFEPVLKGDFYPDDNAFKALTHAIKHSCRTFELFEIARLILEKPERWVCVAKHPDQKEGEPAILHASVPDGLPFLSEQEALNHVFAHYLGDFFTVEEYEAEPPTGNFQIVHRCGMTGEIIAPPNFHRYQALLRQHHANHLAHVPFEKVQARLESVRDQEAIDAWLEKMKKGQRYILKGTAEGEEPTTIPDLEAARLYLLTHAKEKLVRPAYSVRFIGKDLELMPPGHILRRSLEAMHQQQLRFPLETANNLRGRLRRLHLSVYKRGSKGVSYVCAVKRRFREPGEVLSENLADLISFIEAHQNTKAADLPREYLGVVEEKPSDTAASPVVPEASETTGESSAPAATESSDANAPVEAVADGETSAEAAPSESPAEATPTPASAQAPKPDEALVALKRDLHYLVAQGYVIEFSDGRLQVPPPKEVTQPKPKIEDKKPADASKETENTADVVKSTMPPAESGAAAPEAPEAELPTPPEPPAAEAATVPAAPTAPEIASGEPTIEGAETEVGDVAAPLESPTANAPATEPAPDAEPEPEPEPPATPDAAPPFFPPGGTPTEPGSVKPKGED